MNVKLMMMMHDDARQSCTTINEVFSCFSDVLLFSVNDDLANSILDVKNEPEEQGLLVSGSDLNDKSVILQVGSLFFLPRHSIFCFDTPSSTFQSYFPSECSVSPFFFVILR